ncbi:MAG: ATP-binding protein [Treponema sp.]|nr:ATP-binding protein [Treponema sp.]
MKLSDLTEISKNQRAALDAQDSGLPRTILADLPDIKSHALVISGIRRCGKSTLLRQFVKKLKRQFFYLNFDDIRLADFTVDDFGLLDKIITESGARLLFFDEIQSAKHWELYIRQKLDEGFQTAITGSNASLLSRELGTRLTGRQITRELFPFSWKEYCSFMRVKAGPDSFSDYLEKGGFPEYLKSGNREILVQLQSDIIYRDIAVRYGIRDTASLRQLFVYLVSIPSQKITAGKLRQMAGVKSPTTVLEYLSYFRESYLLNFLQCFAWSAKARSLAPKKVYIIDPGIIKTSAVFFSENSGALLENYVYNMLRAMEQDIYYFTDNNGSECDFIISVFSDKESKPTCIQVCWELTTDNQNREIGGLLAAMDFFDTENGLILTFNTRDTIRTSGKEIMVMPAWKYGI